MGAYSLGSLTSTAVSEHPDLVAPSVLDALSSLGLESVVGVVEIDPALSDTAATQAAYGLTAETLANCVIVTGRREGEERTAACLVPATTRADINGFVKRRLDVRKASFLARELAVELTGMEFGGITPIGLPDGWPILVDDRIVRTPLVIIGSGIRRSKLIVPGELFASLPGVEVIPDLGRQIPPENQAPADT
jgi:prolyl-tRNA editing enzyme YbaK/EbsC (Cys-tRNA(Pro) deacylase)